MRNAAPPTTMTPVAAAATMSASSSAPSRSPSHAKALVCSSVRLPTSETTASAASTPLRASVFQLAGAECSWPKQWQSGARPRARLTPMATLKIASSTRAPIAPYTAVPGQRSKPATVSSASGRISANAAADHSGAPNATTALSRACPVGKLRRRGDGEDRCEDEAGGERDELMVEPDSRKGVVGSHPDVRARSSRPVSELIASSAQPYSAARSPAGTARILR